MIAIFPDTQQKKIKILSRLGLCKRKRSKLLFTAQTQIPANAGNKGGMRICESTWKTTFQNEDLTSTSMLTTTIVADISSQMQIIQIIFHNFKLSFPLPIEFRTITLKKKINRERFYVVNTESQNFIREIYERTFIFDSYQKVQKLNQTVEGKVIFTRAAYVPSLGTIQIQKKFVLKFFFWCSTRKWWFLDIILLC